MNTKLFIYILTFLLSIAQNVSAWSGSGASFKPCDDFDWGSFSYELTIKNIDNNNNWPKYQRTDIRHLCRYYRAVGRKILRPAGTPAER